MLNITSNKGAFIRNALLFVAFLIVSMVYFNGLAYGNEFDVEQHNQYIDYQKGQEGIEKNDLLFDIQNGTNNLITATVDIGFDILALIFVIAVIAVAGGVTLRNGQWMKWSMGAMLGTLIAIVAIRIAPIIVLTVEEIGITLLINHMVQFVVSIGFHVAFFMFLIGLFLRSLNKIFEHPKYFKWGRGLLTGSIIILLLSLFSPLVIGNL